MPSLVNLFLYRLISQVEVCDMTCTINLFYSNLSKSSKSLHLTFFDNNVVTLFLTWGKLHQVCTILQFVSLVSLHIWLHVSLSLALFYGQFVLVFYWLVLTRVNNTKSYFFTNNEKGEKKWIKERELCQAEGRFTIYPIKLYLLIKKINKFVIFNVFQL